MSEPPPHPQPRSKTPLLWVVLATATYLALVIAFWGFLSLGLDRDVVEYPDAGPLLGPAMAASATLVTGLVIWRVRSWAGIPIALLGSLLAMLLVAAVGYTGGLVVTTVAHFVISPFVIGAAILSGITVLGMLYARSRII